MEHAVEALATQCRALCEQRPDAHFDARVTRQSGGRRDLVGQYQAFEGLAGQVAARQQFGRQAAADKARATGDQELHRRVSV